ncbi:PP2C family protein-serine/threonine phosphatase [Pararhodospirillum oryzae]|uniref:PP2C family protein-serine/threonine phosphatase n=1 Tax=Pararhodospirillum oryzae TaxID=478448 RepID=UPI0014788827|nr:PP2C family protein-serine/threonine phosphatase [Pararhodospirillum oryzae]
MISLLRRLPVGRRIRLLLVLYVVAAAVPVVSGMRIQALIDSHGKTSAMLRLDLATIAAVVDSSARYQAVLESDATRHAPTADSDATFEQGQLVNALKRMTLPGPEALVARGALLDAAENAQDRHHTLNVLGGRTQNLMRTLLRQGGEIRALMLLLAARTPNGPDLRPPGNTFLTLSRDFVATQRMASGYQAHDTLERLRTLLDQVQASNADSTLTPLLDNARLTVDRTSDTLEKTLSTTAEWTRQSLFVSYISLPRLYRATAALEALAADQERTLRASLEARTRAEVATLAWASAAVLLTGLAAVLLIAASIRRPLTDLDADIKALGTDTDQRPVRGTTAPDELGAMARALEAFQISNHRLRALEIEKRESLAREKEETERALASLDAAHTEIHRLNQQLSAENVRLGAELAISRRLQQMLLPRDEELLQVRGLEVAAFMEPAEEVGGDYYDVLDQGDGRVRIGIGDVTGHGLESGVIMLLTQSAVRTLTARGDAPLPELVEVLNRSLLANVRRLGSGKTLTLALIDYRARPDGTPGGELVIAGQHESVIVCRTDGRIEEVDTLMLGMPLGLVDDVREYLDQTTILLEPGAVVALYTDGITEAENETGAFYGIGRLKEVLAAHHQEPAETIKTRVIEDLLRFRGSGAVLDDVTLIILRQA